VLILQHGAGGSGESAGPRTFAVDDGEAVSGELRLALHTDHKGAAASATTTRGVLGGTNNSTGEVTHNPVLDRDLMFE
jgi:hypothetical protein